MTYLIAGLDPAPYKPLFGAPERYLAGQGILRLIVSEKPGFPCRISLTDRDVGESVLLLNHVSHDVPNPYRASHAIFVTEGILSPATFIDEVPPVFRERALSLRGFSKDGMMARAVLAQPGDADSAIRALLEDPAVEAIHAHNAVRGCFSAEIRRYEAS
jgi:hypothetical protein